MNRWLVPLTSLGLGGVFLVIGLSVGDTVIGLGGMALMVCYGALLLMASRSETMSILHGQPVDERYESFALKALAFSGFLTPLVLLCIGLADLVTGGSGQPYARICLLSVALFVAALVWMRWRS